MTIWLLFLTVDQTGAVLAGDIVLCSCMGKTLYHQCLSMGTSKFNAGGNPAKD